MNRNKDRLECLYHDLESRYGEDDDLVREVKAAIPADASTYSHSNSIDPEQIRLFSQIASYQLS